MIKELQKKLLGKDTYNKQMIEALKRHIREQQKEIEDLRADYGTKAQIERDLAVDKVEELKKRIEISKKDEESMRKSFREISKENWKLKCKIYKATEYIENQMLETYGGKIMGYKISQIDVVKLLDILKGEK